MLEKIFKLKQNNTTVRTELVAGVITFLTMSYILVVNPNILSAAGMDKSALFTATALASVLGTLFMAFIPNLPIAQAPGMGLNSFFAFSVVLGLGYSWQMALTAVFIEGIIFILLTFFNVRELIVKSIPSTIKYAIPVGIGLFITLLGLQNAGLIVKDDNTMLTLGSMSDPHVWVASLGLILTAVLYFKNVHGSFLIGIVAATIFGLILGLVQMPTGGLVSLPPDISPVFVKFEWSNIFTLDMLIIVFTFLFVNLFDTIGTLLGVASKIGITDKDGSFPQIKKALFADALGTTFGAVLGTSTVTSYVESASGVAAGGKTGLTSLSTAMMFVLALFLAPLFLMVPASATAPALILVGLFMITSVVKINFSDMTEALPAFLTIVMMPFAFSIAQGIVFGMLSFVFLKALSGKWKHISITMWVIFVLFIIKLVLDGMQVL
ncbi:MAG: NCS2 family permease [Fermentimonas sp.]|jgi:AGZA family xanthine/uracil permease-like MFS transporter|uniref:NCS2 family permease n=1 Tax=Lascolabacillus TaxID=1924067 RepID=UPI0006B38EFE|nr:MULTISPECIES: NCS2 family permease [Lascolabacillus]MBP6197245.1 NCS2 family permease [Fermentimonas sp.]MDI9625578.1 NCS2 family permease [Bacteroidota bacterium]MCK9501259.1 NCS2 family permease [Lascolabacillus sp.]MDD2606441.1 NCS2 family permease [Lascolabacillus sp.]MDD3657882.1 NCS2 family permease [Lascolabacillus sp.]